MTSVDEPARPNGRIRDAARTHTQKRLSGDTEAAGETGGTF